jgi:hypothetical protein
MYMPLKRAEGTEACSHSFLIAAMKGGECLSSLKSVVSQGYRTWYPLNNVINTVPVLYVSHHLQTI